MATKQTPAQRTRRASKTGAIYKDGDGWRVRVLVGYDTATGKPKFRKVRAESHEKAVEALNRLQSAQYTGKLSEAQGTNLESYLENWLEHTVKPNRAPKTYQQYAYVLRSHVIPTLGKKKADQVKRTDVQKLAGALLSQTLKARAKDPKELPTQTLSRTTVSRTVAVLHAAFENAISDGHATVNPARKIQLPQVTKKPAQFLTVEQAKKLYAKLEHSPVRELIIFMLATGTRPGEAKGVRWQDLDLQNRTVRITGQLQRVNGKLEYRTTTKTNQDRNLPLDVPTVDLLKNLQARHLVNGTTDPEGIVFLNPYGRRLDEKYVNDQLKATCKEAGIPAISPHKLRHTAATLMLMETGDLHRVQKMLGHQQVSLTSDLYGHATTESLRSISEGLGRAIRPLEG